MSQSRYDGSGGVVTLIPTITNATGKIVSNPTDNLVATGNYSPVFISQYPMTELAKDSGLTDIDGNTIISTGLGWKALQYSSNAGYKIDLSAITLASLGITTYTGQDILKVIFYRRLVACDEKLASSGIFIGTNKIATDGAEVTITTLPNSWFKYVINHTITASDITQNAFVRFEDTWYGNATAGSLATQSIEITTPLIYINDLNLFAYYNEQSKKSVDTKTINLTTRQRRWQGKKWYVCGDSITNNALYQDPIKAMLQLTGYTTDGNPGQTIAGCTANIIATPTLLASYDLVTIFAGTNDYGGNYPLGTIADAKTVASTYGSLQKAIDTIFTAYPSIKLAFFTPMQRGVFAGSPTYPAPNGLGFKLEDYVKAIKDVCAIYSVPVCDLFYISGFNSYTLATWTNDNLHPSPLGNTKMYPIMGNFLETL